MKRYNVAILGATGVVGLELMELLAERNFPLGELSLLASPRSKGKVLRTSFGEVEVEEVGPEGFSGMDFAFFCAGGEISKQWATIAVEKGAVVIDNTSAFRMDPRVPLVVPEVNPESLKTHEGIIANPNCSTILLALVLQPIEEAVGLERVVVSTYQAVSGVGGGGIGELHQQTVEYVTGIESQPRIFPVSSGLQKYPIAFNAIPQVDVFSGEDYTKEEWKMILETRKILGRKDLRITATTVRIPVFRSHCESVNIETKEKLTAKACRDILSAAKGVVVQDDPASQLYPMPVFASKKDAVYVGRIREDLSLEKGLNLWLAGDQIRKGAALNALQIAETLMQVG